MKEVGFTDMFEVGAGADMTTMSEAEEWAEAYEREKKDNFLLSFLRKYG